MSRIADALRRDPASFVDAHYDEGFSLRRDELEEVHLTGLRKRFAELRPELPALARLAAEQGIDSIDSIDAAVPLLFPHTVYKSYPLSFIELARFDRLTKWLSGLTTVDLSDVDTSGVQTIDEWIARLEAAAEITLIHTFGTSGKLSFLPRTKAQTKLTTTINAHCIRDFQGYNS